ncbi:hypothetical protein FJY94_04305 [Candidatus Kaiserbacteria bacterium]|nr:hypothetical protein [Candidatus Kaiserbacteria bacterium]
MRLWEADNKLYKIDVIEHPHDASCCGDVYVLVTVRDTRTREMLPPVVFRVTEADGVLVLAPHVENASMPAFANFSGVQAPTFDEYRHAKQHIKAHLTAYERAIL